MTIDSVLYNTKIQINGDLIEAGIAIDDGKIVKIAKMLNLPTSSTKTDLKGHVTLPGLIDSHVHLRDQQLTYKEDFTTGTAAAAAGGVTSVIDMPNNKPVTNSSETLKERMKLSKRSVLVNVAFNSALPEKLEELSEIVEAGAIGFKVYLSNRIGGVDIDDDDSLFRAFKMAAENNFPVLVHAEDRIILEEQKKRMKADGKNDIAAYLAVHSPEAEDLSVRRIIRLVKKSNVQVHFCHISSRLGLNDIIMAKKEGLPVTCEVTPHNLLLSSEQYGKFGTLALTDPPLRTPEDASAMMNALKLGFVDIIASDHAPHALEEKKLASIWETKPGIPGLETTLPLLLTEVNKGMLSLSQLIKTFSFKPAKIFRLSKRGLLKEGNWADLVVVDMKREHTINSSTFFSKAKYSPFDGLKVKGKPIKTFVNGQLIMNEGEIVGEPGTGQIL